MGMPLKLSIAGLKNRIAQLEKDRGMYRALYFNNFHNNKRDNKKRNRLLNQVRFQLIENNQLKRELDDARDLISEFISKRKV